MSHVTISWKRRHTTMERLLNKSTCIHHNIVLAIREIFVISEQSLRDEGKPLFGSLASRQLDCLNALVKFAAVANQAILPEVIKKHCVTLLSGINEVHFELIDVKRNARNMCRVFYGCKDMQIHV